MEVIKRVFLSGKTFLLWLPFEHLQISKSCQKIVNIWNLQALSKIYWGCTALGFLDTGL
jgi:hypothetical protein